MRTLVSVLCIMALILVVAAEAVGASYWIPSAAHTAGAQGTQRRTDVSVLNTCDFDVTVVLTLHTPTEQFSVEYEVLAGRQQIFEDVVGLLTDQDVSGALEVSASAESTRCRALTIVSLRLVRFLLQRPCLAPGSATPFVPCPEERTRAAPGPATR